MNVPLYSPIKNAYTFNPRDLKDEVDLMLRDLAQERTLPFEQGRSVYDPTGLLKIASDQQLNDTSRYQLDENGRRVLIPGRIKTYRVFNLTYLPEEPESEIDIYRSDDPQKKIFWHTYKKPFTWRENIVGTKLHQAVMQFPWEYVQGVRLIYMSPPSIGQIHRDSHPKSNYKYFKEGFASISFNIDDGGGVLKYLDHTGNEHSVDNSVRVFHFDDSVPHGVTPIITPRYQLRMWGKLSVPYHDILDVT